MLRVLSPREASIFACLTDTVVAPAAPMPAVGETDAVFAFDDMLTHAPAINRSGLRALLLGLEVGPVFAGYRARLRRLAPEQRLDYVRKLERTRHLNGAAKAACALAHMSYYGDDRVMRSLGYDADANLARARELRAKEGRW